MSDKKDDCYQCRHRRSVAGESHIACANPDPKMFGNPVGIKRGWFLYPHLFDPVWKAKECSNFEGRSS